MRTTHLVWIATILLLAAAPAFGQPTKPTMQHTPPAADPSVVRQGGDTIADAVAIGFPYEGDGTTVGYTDDYDEVCPYTQSTSPDVVYAITPDDDVAADIDLLGSDYDTKVYVYDVDLNLVACNDDFYPDYVSRLENVPLQGLQTYYIVIDGYGGDAGPYHLVVTSYHPCNLTCPAGAQLEGEPPLEDGYEDAFNGGCQYPQFGINFSHLTGPVYCAVSGWYEVAGGGQTRDNDYIDVYLPDSGVLEITGDAEYQTYLFHAAPTDCATFALIDNVLMGPCEPQTLTISGEPGELVWLFVIPSTFEGPVNEYQYILETNLDPVATEQRSWSEVKGLYR